MDLLQYNSNMQLFFVFFFSFLQLFVSIDKEKYPKLAAYIERGYATIPHLEELNKAAKEILRKIFQNFDFQV